jgi:hypothetical protein
MRAIRIRLSTQQLPSTVEGPMRAGKIVCCSGGKTKSSSSDIAGEEKSEERENVNKDD